MEVPPRSEAEKVRAAVAESIALGTLTDDLILLVGAICRRRVGPGLCDDLTQDVLLRLLLALPRIDLERDAYHYTCTVIVQRWRRTMRDRRIERRYLLMAAEELLNDMPSSVRLTATRQAFASSHATFRLKYF